MSAEAYDHSPEETEDVYAVRLFNHDRTWFASMHDFTQKIFNSYEETPEGATELIRMKRVAQFITNSDSSSFSPDVEAVFTGELIGSQLLNYMHPKVAPITGLAQGFMQGHLAQSQHLLVEGTRPYYDPLTESTIVPPLIEPLATRQGRMAYYAARLRNSLSDGDEENSLPDGLETFLQTVAVELHSDPELIRLTKIGARLILNEHLQTSLNLVTDDLLDTYGTTLPAKKMLEKGRDSYRPSDEALAEMTGMHHVEKSSDALFSYEDVAFVRTNIYRKFKKIFNSMGDIDLTDDTVAQKVYADIKEELDTFNKNFAFISEGDSLVICGDFFAYATDGESGAITRYSPRIEVRGEFKEINVVEIPTNKELLEVIKLEEREGGIETDSDGTKSYQFNTHTFSPSLHIINPTLLVFGERDNSPEIKYLHGLTLDVPLLYRDVDYQLLKLKET